MSTELDRYGMSPEERVEFEDFREQHIDTGIGQPPNAAQAWAACAKLHRERVEDLKDLLTKQFGSGWEDWDQCSLYGAERRIKELETRLEIDPQAHGYDGIACRDVTIKIQDEQIKELEAENARLLADAAMKGEG